MRIERSPLYQKINLIDNSSYRSLVFFLVDKMWDEFYDKRVFYDGGKTANWKGQTICNEILKEYELFAKHLSISKDEKDIGRVLCFLAPAWIGRCISKEPVKGWREVRTYRRYRDPDWRNGTKRFSMWIREYIETFSCEDIWTPLMEVYDKSHPKSRAKLHDA